MQFTWTEIDDAGRKTVHTSTDECDAFLHGKRLIHRRGKYVSFKDEETALPIPLSENHVELIKKTPGEDVRIPYDPREVFYWCHKHGKDLRSFTAPEDTPPTTPIPEHASSPAPQPPPSLAAVLNSDDYHQPPTKEWMRTTRKRLYEQLRVLIPLHRRLEETRNRLICEFLSGIPKHVTQASTSQYLLTFHRNGQRAMRCIDTIIAGVDALEETATAMERFNDAQGDGFFPKDFADYDSDDEADREFFFTLRESDDQPPDTEKPEKKTQDPTGRDLVEPLEHGLKALLRPDPGSIYFNFIQ